MDAPSFTGDDERDYSGHGGSIEAIFWRTYAYAVRTGCLDEFLAIYRPMARFADLVAQAEARARQEAA